MVGTLQGHNVAAQEKAWYADKAAADGRAALAAFAGGNINNVVMSNASNATYTNAASVTR